jgi:hypothetical protein
VRGSWRPARIQPLRHCWYIEAYLARSHEGGGDGGTDRVRVTLITSAAVRTTGSIGSRRNVFHQIIVAEPVGYHSRLVHFLGLRTSQTTPSFERTQIA